MTTRVETLEGMLRAKALFTSATELCAGDQRPDTERVTALIGALAIAVAEHETPEGALAVAVDMLAQLRPALHNVRLSALEVLTRGASS